MRGRHLILGLLFVIGMGLAAPAALRAATRLLLLGQGPDGHPPGTHEFLPGMRILQACLKRVPEVETKIISADEPWSDGPQQIDKADGVVLFLSQGAHWIHADPGRLRALLALKLRGGALVGLHWGIGTKQARDVELFLELLGGCHGGPDRKYKVLETDLRVVDPLHPITRGLSDFRARDEFYYDLKFIQPSTAIQPILKATIDGQPRTVAWGWQRKDGGRSFGFSGLHFHQNWKRPAYRRLVTQAVMWTLGRPVPEKGINVDVDERLLTLTGDQR